MPDGICRYIDWSAIFPGPVNRLVTRFMLAKRPVDKDWTLVSMVTLGSL